MAEKVTDTNQLPVQLNLTVPFEYREHLSRVAATRGTSVASLIRDLLLERYPQDPVEQRDQARRATRDAGATK